MKFEIDIPEERIQEIINNMVNGSCKREGLSFELRMIIQEAVKEKIRERINIEFPVSIKEKIDEFIGKEIYGAMVMKIPGWAKRRIKEMLEAVRREFEKKECI